MTVSTTFLTTPQAISLSGATTGWNVGIASGAPAGATGVLVSFFAAAGHAAIVNTRMTGSSDAQTPVQTLGVGGAIEQSYSATGVPISGGTAGELDIYLSATSGITCWLMAYFGPEWTWFSAAVQLSITTSMQILNLASNCPGAVAIFADNQREGIYRQNGSGDTAQNLSGGSLLIGLDGSQNLQAQNQSSAGGLYVKGYTATGVVWHNDMVAVGGSFTAGSYQNVPQAAGDPASGILGYAYYTDGTSAIGLIGAGCNTGTYNPSSVPIGDTASAGTHVFAGPSLAQINPVSATQVLNEVGYFVAPSAPSIVARPLGMPSPGFGGMGRGAMMAQPVMMGGMSYSPFPFNTIPPPAQPLNPVTCAGITHCALCPMPGLML